MAPGLTAVRFGVQGSGQLVGDLPDPAIFRRLASEAEELGFDSIWAGEHLSFRNPILDVVVALSTFAAVTQRITLGAAVVLLPLRHPSIVAKELASLDYVSGGRVVLGVGVGGEGAQDFEAAGVPVRERGARTDEAMQALRVLLHGGPASFAGRFFRFEGVEIEPRAAQPGGPPLWVGGRSPAAIRRAATLGDGWMPIWVSPERLAEGAAELPPHVERAVMLPACVGGTAEGMRSYLSSRYGADFSRQAVERYCVFGEPERIADRLAAYARAGARHVIFNPSVPPERMVEQLRLLAELRPVGAEAA